MVRTVNSSSRNRPGIGIPHGASVNPEQQQADSSTMLTGGKSAAHETLLSVDDVNNPSLLFFFN